MTTNSIDSCRLTNCTSISDLITSKVMPESLYTPNEGEHPSYQSPLLGNVTMPPPQSSQPPPLQRSLNPYNQQPSGFKGGFHPSRWGIGRLFFFGLGIVIIITLGVGIFVLGNFQNFSLFKISGPVTITYWGIDQPESVMQPLIDQYESSHPNVKINYERRTLTQYRQTLVARIAQGNGPDIFSFHNTWLPMLTNSLDSVPGNIYSSSDVQSLFYPVVRENLTLNGSLYGIPIEYDGLALVYNPDMLRAAGFSSPPTTWSDIWEVYGPKITKFNQNNSVSTGTAALGTSTNVDYFSDILGAMMLQNGTTMIDGNNHVAFDSSIVTNSGGTQRNLGADALEFYTLMASPASGKGNPVWDDTLPSSTQSFATGRVAMVILPARALPDLAAAISQAHSGVTIAVAPLPQILPLGEGSPSYWATYWSEGVSKTSTNKAASWDFIKFLSSKESEITLYNEEVKIRGYGEPPSRTDLADQFKSDPIASAFLAGAPNAQSWYLASNTEDQGLDDGMDQIFGDAITSILKKSVPPEDAIKKAATDAVGVLSQYQLAQPNSAANASQ